MQRCRAVTGEGDAEGLIEAAIQRLQMRGGAPVVLVGVTGALLRGRQSGKGAVVLARIVQMAVGIARDHAQIEVRRDIESQLAGDREVVVVVVMALLARRQQVERGDRRRAAVQVGDIGTVMKGVLRATDAGGLVKAVEGATLDRRRQFHRPRARLGDHVDHSADGIRAVQSALRAAQNFNPLDVLRQQLPEIERRVGVARIAEVDAVHQDLGVIGIGTTHEHRSLGARTALLHHVEAGNVLEHGGKRALLARCDVFCRDDADAAGHVQFRGGNAGRGDYDGPQRIRIGCAIQAGVGQGGKSRVNSAALPSARRAVRPVVMGKAPEAAHTRADGSWLQKLASARQARRTAGPASPAATRIGSRKAGLRAFEQELAGSSGSPSRAPQGAQWLM